jgi:copper resistance protein K
MRNLTLIILLISAISVGAAENLSEPLLLKDGSYLFINEDDTMRMVDKDGKRITMKDNVEMELRDGTLIIMKNKKIWRHNHRKTHKCQLRKPCSEIVV